MLYQYLYKYLFIIITLYTELLTLFYKKNITFQLYFNLLFYLLKKKYYRFFILYIILIIKCHINLLIRKYVNVK